LVSLPSHLLDINIILHEHLVKVIHAAILPLVLLEALMHLALLIYDLLEILRKFSITPF
jgi:hypothetical protein